MNRLHTLIDPTSTAQLLNNLNLAIDETKLVRTINILQDDIFKIESVTGPSSRTRYLRAEVATLQSRLNEVRRQVVFPE